MYCVALAQEICVAGFNSFVVFLGFYPVSTVRNLIFPGKLTMFRGITHFLTQFGVSIGEKKQPIDVLRIHCLRHLYILHVPDP